MIICIKNLTKSLCLKPILIGTHRCPGDGGHLHEPGVRGKQLPRGVFRGVSGCPWRAVKPRKWEGFFFFSNENNEKTKLILGKQSHVGRSNMMISQHDSQTMSKH